MSGALFGAHHFCLPMKYIICAGTKEYKPRHLTKVNGENLIDRTIRLLKENGITDVWVSTKNPAFKNYNRLDYDSSGDWLNCFAPLDEPACYIFGDVYFSPEAIKKIVETETDTVEFFASAKPYAPEYPKIWSEPFAFKVQDQELFRKAIEKTKYYRLNGNFYRNPISWELWQVIKGTPLGVIEQNYTVINDYTCDIDCPEDAEQWNF